MDAPGRFGGADGAHEGRADRVDHAQARAALDARPGTERRHVPGGQCRRRRRARRGHPGGCPTAARAGRHDTAVIAEVLHVTRRTVQRHVAALGDVGQAVSPLVATDVAPVPEREATPSTLDVADIVVGRSADVATLSPPPIGGRSGDMSPTAGRDSPEHAAGFARYVAEAGTDAAWARVGKDSVA